MEKKEVRRKGKRVILLSSILLFIIFCSFVVSATGDVAYIYKSSKAVDENIVDVFEDMRLSVERIQENALASTDFSNYKIIFVGDERFRKVNLIPVLEKPSVIANYYHGDEFGLTDTDGVSKLASNAPLSVKINSSVLKVYTKAKYNSISLPYYYLDDKNKVPGMQTVARTYTGNDNGYNFGDVISYADAGTQLINGKITLGKICFYGIIESDYWTPAAKQMFINCVNYVGMTCQDDNDCPDEEIGDLNCSDSGVYQDIMKYHCENPGTVHSECVDELSPKLLEDCGNDYCGNWGNNYCKSGDVYKNRTCYDKGCSDGMCFNNHFINETIVQECDDFWETCSNGECIKKPIECYNNSICGTDRFLGQELCQENDVFDYYINFTCKNPGLPSSFCSNSTSVLLKENCTNFCANGECVQCLQDSNCPLDYYEEPYCSSGDAYHNLIDYSCQNYKCISQRIPELLNNCTENEICSNGECRETACKKNTDCGINGFSGWKYCQNGNSYEDFISFTCFNPGKINSYCTNYTLPILQEYCDFECISGECYTCFNNLSCGTDGFIGNKYCEGNDVYQNYKQFECVNPTTPDSDCLSSIFPKLIEECVDVCILGGCVDIECYNDTECNDFNASTIDRCINPATINSYCSHTPINCINNEDCGITGFIGNEFCFEDDVFKNYQNSTCVNAGTINSYCDISLTPEFLIDCGEDECGNWSNNYCKVGDVYHSRTCYDKSCNNGACVSSATVEEQLVEECAFACVNGSCYGECMNDSQCQNDYYSDNYCIGNDIYHDLHDFSCGGYQCNEDIIPELVEHCADICINGSCVDLIHDVALIDFTNSTNGIFLEYENNTDILQNPPILICGDIIKSKVRVKNKGNFIENVTLTGNSNSVPFSLNPVNNLIPGDSAYRTSLSPYITIPLTEGFYNISINAIIPVDDFPLNNIARRQIQVICPECFTNNDCGSQTSELMCIGKNVTNHTITPVCVDGTCDSEEDYTLVEECADMCVGSECVDITCYNNSDCGEDGFFCSKFCQEDDVYRNYREFICLNPGTSNSSCINNAFPKLYEDCREGYCDGWGENYCKGKEVWRNRTCYDLGCSSGTCLNTSSTQEQFVETCADVCIDGHCEDIICYNNSDCGSDGYIGDYYCQNNDVYRNYQNWICLFQGTPESSCFSSVTDKLIGECVLGCLNGGCMGCK